MYRNHERISSGGDNCSRSTIKSIRDATKIIAYQRRFKFMNCKSILLGYDEVKFTWGNQDDKNVEHGTIHDCQLTWVIGCI
jgi:hypothetical protein